MTRPTALAALVLSAVLLAPAPPAQAFVEDVQASAPGYFVFARPGEPVVSVNAVGAVGATGRYVVAADTPLADLLVLTGGVSPDRSGRATVRLHRGGETIVSAEARDLFGTSVAPVPLQDGDVVEVVGLTSSVPGYYVHTEPGSEPVEITAAGAFGAPGLYVVDPGTTVGELVALAGGLGAFGAREERTEVTATVRLFRNGVLAFETPLEDLYARETRPLEAGDVVDLQVTFVRRTSIWRDVLSIVTAGLGVAILVERLAN